MMLDHKTMERMLFWRFFAALVVAAMLGGALVALVFWIL